MKTSPRTLGASGRLLGLALLALTAAVPAEAQFHGAGVGKACDDRCPGTLASCTIGVSNQDTFNDLIRIDSLCDVVHHTNGDVTICRPGGSFILAKPADPGDEVDFPHTFAVNANDPNPLLDDVVAIGVDLGTNLPLNLRAQVGVTTLECCVDQDCNDNNICTTDTCNTDTHTCQHVAATGVVCRSAVGVCDQPELCSGTTCPTDAKKPSGTVCRSSAGVCDPQEVCNGSSNDCPADTLVPSGTICRSAAGSCDIPEACTGNSPACPADSFKNSGTVCRSAAGVCDVPEVCTGGSAACPGDVLVTSGSVCRSAAGVCDVQEVCTGANVDCPSDMKASSGTTCTPPGSNCQGICPGNSNDCSASCPDVGVTLTTSTPTINAGETATYNIVVMANGPGPSNGVVLTDTLPPGLTWTPSGPDAGSCTVSGGNSLTCNFGTVPEGQMRKVTVSTTTTRDNCPLLSDTATVTATVDTNPNNNSSGPVNITVICPNLQLDKTASPDTVSPSSGGTCSGGITSITLKYAGGGCAATDNTQNNDSCSGNTNNSNPATLKLSKGGTFTGVALNGIVTATVSGADLQVQTSGAGGTETVKFKIDCSQPIFPGDQFGSIEVVGFTSKKGGTTSMGTLVTYTYKVTNIGDAVCDDIKVTDDKLGMIGTIPTLAPGGMATLTSSAMISQTTVNTANADGHVHNSQVSCTATDTAKVTAPGAACVLGYPFVSANPRTSVVFNESEALAALEPSIAVSGGTVRAFYTDEHALTLGVRQVVVIDSSGAHVTNYPVSPPPSGVSGSVIPPAVGTTALTGPQAGTDPVGRPLFPALFLTDVTNAPNSMSGDWQFGGTPIPPDAVFGTWKAAVRTVDTIKGTTTVTPDADPAKNGLNLDGGDPVPAGTRTQGFTAEARWNVDDLGLTPGHTYRVQVMVHDGDQNKTGGDVGEACATVVMTGGE